MLPFRLPASAPRKRGRTVDPLGRTPDVITRNVWLADIPPPDRILHMIIRGKCFLCHQAIHTTSDPDAYSLVDLVAHFQMHKNTLESAMSPQLHTILARHHHQTEKRIRCAGRPMCSQAYGAFRTAVATLEAFAAEEPHTSSQ